MSSRPGAALAIEVASQLRLYADVERAVEDAAPRLPYPPAVSWMPHTIARGCAGLALLCGQVDRCLPGEGWDLAAHEHLEAAAAGAQQQPSLTDALFTGLAGVAFTAWYLSRNGARYQRLRQSLDERLLADVPALVEQMARSGDAGMPVEYFDLISGIAGVGAYLLCRCEDPEPLAGLRALLSALVEMVLADVAPPAWHTPAEDLHSESFREQFPHGNLNCGLAHGIPGPLALLALSSRTGIDVAGLGEAIRRTADWLLAHGVRDEWGINWPSAVPVRPPAAPAGAPGATAHAGWCYGSPGVARALFLAGDALGDRALRGRAIEAMAAVVSRPASERRLGSPTFCHGLAGLLQITFRFARDTELPVFVLEVDRLREQIIASADPTARLRFTNVEPDGQRVDHPGLLDGAPGSVLALLTCAFPEEPAWDRLFLLS